MKRLGIIVLVLAGFVGGMAFVYSCGGGGSDVFAAGDADTLDGLHASAFAESVHSHPGLPTGVHWVGAAEFQEGYSNVDVRGEYFGVSANNANWPAIAWGPINIPFQCTITEIQFKAKDNSSTEIILGIYDGSKDSNDYYTPIASKSTSGWAPTSDYGYFSTGTISLYYDPSTFRKPWWIRVELNDFIGYQRIQWVKMYYTIP